MSFSKIEREISGCLSENFWRVCENWIPLVHRNIFVENFFSSFLAFWDKEEKDPDLVAKNFCRFVEKAFYILRVHSNILVKTFFWEKSTSADRSRTLSKNFRRFAETLPCGCQKWILRVHWINLDLKKEFLERDKFFRYFADIDWNSFRLFGKNSPAEYPKLHSAGLEFEFRGKIFLYENLSLFRILTKKSQRFEKFFGFAVKTVFYVSTAAYGWKLFLFWKDVFFIRFSTLEENFMISSKTVLNMIVKTVV